MRALRLRFDAAPQLGRGRMVGALMLVLAALAAAATARQHEQQQRQLDTLRGQQTRLLARVQEGKPTAATERQPLDAAMQRRLTLARAVIEPLAVPWEQLFSTLESVPTRGVQLQELVPDAQARTLRLSGQASALPAVLAYMDRLAEQPLLGQVHLVSSQPALRDGAPAMSFAILASWRSP